MTLAAFMAIHAVIALAFGIAFVLAPAWLLSLYGITLDAAGILMTRLFGAALIQIGLLAWLAKQVADAVARRAVLLAYFLGLGVGFVIILLGQVAGVLNALGWTSVAIYLLLALGYGYFQFVKPSA